MDIIQNNKCFPFESETNSGGEMKNIFCFHHAGGAAATYRKWTWQHLPVRIICVELMGKGSRRGEAYIEDSQEVAIIMAKEIAARNGDAPFSLFGHSMGAVLAFLTTYYLEQYYNLKPDCLVVAGRQAPQDENLSEFKTYMDDQKLIEEMRSYRLTPEEVLNNPQFMNYYLPEIRRDYRLSESFSYHGEKINVPIIAHAAAADVGADKAMMAGWSQVTTSQFYIREFQGSHFFVLENEDYLTELVADLKR